MTYTSTNTPANRSGSSSNTSFRRVPSPDPIDPAPVRTVFRPYPNVEQVGDDLVFTFADGQSKKTIKNYFTGLDSNAKTSKLALLSSSVSVEPASTFGGNLVVKGNEEDNLIFGDDLGLDIDGEAGDDVIQAGEGADRLSGGEGSDWLYGGAGNDRLSGGVGNDELHGEAGNDELRGGAGNDTLDGGTGDDSMDGGPGDDKLNGGVGDDQLSGGSGDDVLEGGEGDDYMRGRAGSDILHGGEGSDSLYGDDDHDFLFGGVGDDRLYGEAGADMLFGGDGNDRLNGGDGNDELYGEEGSDVLIGGLGNDTYHYTKGDGRDWILNRGGDQDYDVMLFTGNITVEQLWFRRVDNEMRVTLVGTEEGVTFVDWYLNDDQRVDEFRLSNGGPVRYLKGSDIEALVGAMAAFSPPVVGSSSLPNDCGAVLAPVLAAKWT
ncbi:calcium-binding protein [Herbaspirillum sp. alder98]|uniref:calcium-binding protein n=1 Tax=Herbaspirillum sp. alder98 TaxID=2913096 RepID=UPI001CD83291|nr:calcium-binding protein [Herbaspirillum sp. alder98]MCA1323191.1 hypothetical protein [Herbaspirillum sp. alder98]